MVLIEIPRGADAADECSESCWGDMEDVGDEAIPHPPTCQADDRVVTVRKTPGQDNSVRQWRHR